MQNKISYDEYIRSILGYPAINSINNIYQDTNQNVDYENTSDIELERCYPEIYKIVYPMVMTKCNNLRGSISSEDIENMTDEIYYDLEEKEENRSSTNQKNEVRATLAQTSVATKTASRTVDNKEVEKFNDKRETRQINRGLRDLIKILLIKELLNRPGRPNRPRPPMPGPGPRPPVRPPMRPPFVPGQGGPGRPPFNREFEDYNYDIFQY